MGSIGSIRVGERIIPISRITLREGKVWFHTERMQGPWEIAPNEMIMIYGEDGSFLWRGIWRGGQFSVDPEWFFDFVYAIEIAGRKTNGAEEWEARQA